MKESSQSSELMQMAKSRNQYTQLWSHSDFCEYIQTTLVLLMLYNHQPAEVKVAEI